MYVFCKSEIPKPHKFRVDVMPESRKAEIRKLKEEEPVLYAGKSTNLEMPVSRKLKGKTAWNTASLTDDGERLQRAAALTLKAATNSRRAARKLENYTKPSQLPLRTLPADYRRPGQWEDPPSAPKPPPTHNRQSTRPTIKTRSFQHSGVFEFNGQEGQWMWSDTGSFARDGPGDVVKVKNPHAYNFAAPTSVL